nr:PAS domain S-box protein [Mesorhizobium sp.]
MRRALAVRRSPVAGASIAVILVASSALLRWAIGSSIAGAPFLTFYPAIVLVTLFGGMWPGVLAAVLSAVVAWTFFLPLSSPDLATRVTSTAIFGVLSAVNVIVVGVLNSAVRQVIAQEENLRILIESSPTGIVVVDDEGNIKLVNSSTEKLFGYARTELLGRTLKNWSLMAGRLATYRSALPFSESRKPVQWEPGLILVAGARTEPSFRSRSPSTRFSARGGSVFWPPSSTLPTE